MRATVTADLQSFGVICWHANPRSSFQSAGVGQVPGKPETAGQAALPGQPHGACPPLSSPHSTQTGAPVGSHTPHCELMNFNTTVVLIWIFHVALHYCRKEVVTIRKLHRAGAGSSVCLLQTVTNYGMAYWSWQHRLYLRYPTIQASTLPFCPH